MGIGLNYAEHAAETGAAIPKEPVLFMKATSSINGPNDNIVLPRGSEHTDWEVELGVIIGERAKYVSEADALNYVAGYCTSHDVSERSFQKDRGGLWDKGKGCDTFGPLGPWLVTKDEIPDPQNLKLWLEVDGQRMQDGTTATMIFPVQFLVSYLSQFFTLHPGDIITTGTPSGVGMSRNPPVFSAPANRPPRSRRPRRTTTTRRRRLTLYVFSRRRPADKRLAAGQSHHKYTEFCARSRGCEFIDGFRSLVHHVGAKLIDLLRETRAYRTVES